MAHHRSRTILAGSTVTESRSSTGGRAEAGITRRVIRFLSRDVRDHKVPYLAGLLALLLLGGAGVWSHYGVERSLREVLRDELQTVLDADVTALELWLKEQKAEAKRWAAQPDVRDQIINLVEITRSNAAPREELLQATALSELRKALLAYIEEEEGRTAYAVIDRAGLVLAARDDSDVGIHLNAAGMADNAQVFAGQTLVARPHPQGSFAADRPVRRDAPMIWVGTPVRDRAARSWQR